MSDARLSFFLFVAAFLARLVCAMGALLFGTDGTHYLLMADWMREGRFHEALLVAYHPLYPLLTAVMRTFTVSSQSAGEAVSVLLGAAATVPLFHMVRAVFGRPAAFVAAILYAFSPQTLLVESDVMTEGAYMFFLFLSMWLTWRVMEEPSPERGAVLGMAATATFLTRPEGLLALVFAVAWPLAELLRRRDQWLRRIGSAALTAVVIVALLSPYLLWVHSVRGRWAMSVRPSLISAEQAVGVTAVEGEGTTDSLKSRIHVIYLKSVFTLTLSGALIPFYVIGLAGLRRIGWWRGAFYLSFPLGLMGGTLFALRTHNFMSERYLLAPMSLMAAIAALGGVSAYRWSERRWTGVRWRPVLTGTLFMLLGVLPGLRCLSVRRQECLSYPLAARWILDHGPRPRMMAGPTTQVSYLCGSRCPDSPDTRPELEDWLKTHPVEYFVYSEKDLQGKAAYVSMLNSFDRLEPAVEIVGPPRTLKVYVQRVK